MKAWLRRARLRHSIAVAMLRAGIRRMRDQLALVAAIAYAAARGRRAITNAFTQFEPRKCSRLRAVSTAVVDAARLKRLADALRPGDTAGLRAWCEQVFVASERAEARFQPASLQSYVDVSARVTALRAFAGYVSSSPAFGGELLRVTERLVEQGPDRRETLLAHAAALLDAGRPHDAAPWIRRALRIQAVCPTAQELLGRAVEGVEYDLRDRFCPMPFTHLSTGYQGDAFVCCCPAWIPYPVGNVIDAPSADAVWNSQAAAEVRRSIHDGDFSYCSRTLCSYIAAQKLPRKSDVSDPVLRRYIDERTVILPEAPTMVQLNHDQTCNLSCPSCRTGIITAGPAEQRIYVEAADRVLLPLLRTVQGMTYISGGGEAFASAHYRRILGSLNRRDYPGLYVFLITNGQLLDVRRWSEFADLPEMILNLSVSIDAARPETYERLRRPGKWNVLMSNLEVMAAMRAAGRIARLQINFVVQADNFRELPEFFALGERLGVDSFWLQRLTNYGSFAEPLFAAADVTVPSHPDHAELLSILRQPFMRDPRINMEMLMPLLPEIVKSDLVVPRLLTRLRPEMLERAVAEAV